MLFCYDIRSELAQQQYRKHLVMSAIKSPTRQVLQLLLCSAISYTTMLLKPYTGYSEKNTRYLPPLTETLFHQGIFVINKVRNEVKSYVHTLNRCHVTNGSKLLLSKQSKECNYATICTDTKTADLASTETTAGCAHHKFLNHFLAFNMLTADGMKDFL